MGTNKDGEKINEMLTRGVEEVFVLKHLEEALLSGKKLRVKYGIDPTGPSIHLGRASTLRKVKAFQDAGHQIVLVVGDFTARIGDPSDKLEKRPMLSREKVEENTREYEALLGKILDLNHVEIRLNSEWLSNLRFDEVADLAESFSVQQMSARRNFKDRMERGEEISLREFLYPLMQGYDSFAVRADVEIGGFDQLFNLQAGRAVQKHYGQPEQDIITTEMLPGTDGRKMSTSWKNVININDEPNDMFGKIMSLDDKLINNYFILCTDLSSPDIENIIKKHSNPRDQKMILGKEIVALYHNKEAGDAAEAVFIKTFQKKEMPDNTKEFIAPAESFLSDVLIDGGIVPSKSEWKRLVEGGAVHDVLNKTVIKDLRATLNNKPLSLKIGKKVFVKIIPE
ncbi:MAG: tyrosine--tRNA ligase [Parcubacteria group bacterium]|nr:tyrosine--tRNA ligase [Parcubacteria group bacterium]